MRIGQAQNIACELYDGALHTQTYSEERDLVLTCITHGLDLALDAAVAEARSHHDTGPCGPSMSATFSRVIFSELTYVSFTLQLFAAPACMNDSQIDL